MRRHMSLAAIGWPNSINFESLSKWWFLQCVYMTLHDFRWFPHEISWNAESLLDFASYNRRIKDNKYASWGTHMLKSMPDFSSTSRTTAWRSPVRGCDASMLRWDHQLTTRGDLWKCYSWTPKTYQLTYQLTYNPMHTMTMRSTNSNEHSGTSLCSTSWRVNLSCFDMLTVHRLVVGNIERKPFVAADTCKASDSEVSLDWFMGNLTENPHMDSGKNM